MEEFQKRYAKGSAVIEEAIEEFHYNGDSCACQYPRFIQLVGIDCLAYGHSFKAWETSLLIKAVKPYFNTSPIMSSENYSEKWTYKRYQSEFTLNWRDLSLQVDRDVLKLHQLNAPPIGKETLTPIPLYVGLYGHSYPS